MKVSQPITKLDFIRLFKKLKIKKGSDILVHSSLKKFGYIINGPNDLIDSLISCVGSNGTLLFPAHNKNYTDPIGWKNPKVPLKWVKKIRRHQNIFNIKTSPVINRGKVSETVLLYPNVFRSNHPLSSISAIGKKANYYTKLHPIHESEGIRSPLGRLYKRKGLVLLIGVGFDSSTSIHLSEYMANVSYLNQNSVKVLTKKGSKKQYISLKRYPKSSKNFIRIEKDLRYKSLFKEIYLNNVRIILYKIDEVTDFLMSKLLNNPYYLQ